VAAQVSCGNSLFTRCAGIARVFLAEQVRRGMLVRNGLAVLHVLGNFYRPETLMEDTIDRDLLLVRRSFSSFFLSFSFLFFHFFSLRLTVKMLLIYSSPVPVSHSKNVEDTWWHCRITIWHPFSYESVIVCGWRACICACSSFASCGVGEVVA
jgi:hypothetical protein